MNIIVSKHYPLANNKDYPWQNKKNMGSLNYRVTNQLAVASITWLAESMIGPLIKIIVSNAIFILRKDIAYEFLTLSAKAAWKCGMVSMPL